MAFRTPLTASLVDGFAKNNNCPQRPSTMEKLVQSTESAFKSEFVHDTAVEAAPLRLE